MPYSYTLSTVVPASPAEIYRAWLDSVAHSEMTGGEATMSDEVGADVSAWDGYITGRNLELVPGERIVQSWRTTEFDDEFEDSIVTIVLQETEDGTLLTLQHSNVPDEHKSYEEGGWQLFRADDRLFRRAGGRRSRRAGAGAARERADACGNKGSERPPQSARGQAADDQVERTEGEVRCSSEEAEGGRTRDKSCQESLDRRSKENCEKILA
jgi:uncharacterized protein YndB with AHSA1/START domain